MRVGVLGLGSIGARHAKNILDMGHQVIGFDPNLSGHVVGITEVATMEEFYGQEYDAVVIASPSSLHTRHKMIIQENPPILIEKPIGTSEMDVDILQQTPLGNVRVGNNLRFHPCVKWAKNAIDGMGKIEHASFHCEQFNSKPDYIRDGVTLNWGAHEVDLALHLLGPAEVEFASINEDDTIAYIKLKHERGGTSNIDLDYIRNPPKRGFLISGYNGNILCNLEESPPKYDWNQTYIDEMEDFLEYGGKQCATGEDGLATLKIILDAKRKAGL